MLLGYGCGIWTIHPIELILTCYINVIFATILLLQRFINWPNLFLNIQPNSFSMDIFPLGCIFYFVITEGRHPFGDGTRCDTNVLEGKYTLAVHNEASIYTPFYPLIRSMISMMPESRPDCMEILNGVRQMQGASHDLPMITSVRLPTTVSLNFLLELILLVAKCA